MRPEAERPQLRLNNSRAALPYVSALAVASQRRGEEANGEGDDDGRASANCFMAWQDNDFHRGQDRNPANAVAEEDSHKIDLKNST